MLSETLTNLQTFFAEHQRTGRSLALSAAEVETLALVLDAMASQAAALEKHGISPVAMAPDEIPANVAVLGRRAGT